MQKELDNAFEWLTFGSTSNAGHSNAVTKPEVKLVIVVELYARLDAAANA